MRPRKGHDPIKNILMGIAGTMVLIVIGIVIWQNLFMPASSKENPDQVNLQKDSEQDGAASQELTKAKADEVSAEKTVNSSENKSEAKQEDAIASEKEEINDAENVGVSASPAEMAKDAMSILIGPEDLHSEAAFVWDRQEKAAIFEKNPDKHMVPASLVKMMTVYSALQVIEDMNAQAPVDVNSYLEMVESNASMAGFFGNEPTTYRDLLFGTMLPSGGEAAASLAINTLGSLDAFVYQMNTTAQGFGLTNTSFGNVSGLDVPANYSTARDMAMFLDQALEDPNFREIFTARSYVSTSTEDHPEGVEMYSTVLARLDPASLDAAGFQVLGGKSGTELAGQNWATLGVKEGKEYIVITMGAPLGDLNAPNDFQIDDTVSLYSAIP